MIGRLAGTLLEIDGSRLLLDVHGIGYEIDVSSNVLANQPSVGGALVLHTHLVTSEDGQRLFGFAGRAEREMFRALIRVGGVGPKLGIALLSGMPLAALATAIAGEDVARLTKISGVGRKTAERLIVELKDKLGAMASPADGSPSGVSRSDPAHGLADDAEAALIALGYRPAEAARWVGAVFDPALGVEQLVRAALRAASDK